MIWLWIAAALVSAGLAALVVQRAAAAARRAGAENPALAVYRRQMTELDELADRGLIAEGERRSVRAETGRRLLAAAGRAEPAATGASPAVILTIAAAIPLVAVAVYAAIGAPGLADQPFAARLADWESAAKAGQPLDPAETAAVWRDIAAHNPNDPTPLTQFAGAELSAGQPGEAVQALHRAIALAPTHASLWEELGLTLMLAGDGSIGPDAQDAFRHALALDPGSSNARYFLARARIAGGDLTGGLADWKALDATLPADDPRKTELAQEIQQVTTAGALPPPASQATAQPSPPAGVGPAQIQGMVDQLAAQLKANPDDPQGWVRLVRAYTVLGETDRRDAALAQAKQHYVGHADVLSALDAAAKSGP